MSEQSEAELKLKADQAAYEEVFANLLKNDPEFRSL